MRHLSLAIVGADYPNKRGPSRRFAIELLRPGDPVQLRPEPTNKVDPCAVAVYDMAGVQIGYVNAERAMLVWGFFTDGREIEAVFQRRAQFGCWVRIALDGAPMEMPELQDRPTKADADRVVIRGEFDQREYDD